MNVNKDTVNEAIKYFKNSTECSAEFGNVIKNNQGGYLLNKLQCTAINTIKTVKTELDGAILVKQAIDYLNNKISILENENQEIKHKADYFDALVDRNLLTNCRDTAKELNISQNDFIQFLIKKYLYYKIL